jgi:isopenicillin-N epimerase
MSDLAPDDDGAWSTARGDWQFSEDTIYLNHGSFGPPPITVRRARRRWRDALDEQPMDVFVRRLEPDLDQARAALARFTGTLPENLVFVENATFGMNIVARSVGLDPEAEVLLTDHEYGAVLRIWQRACREARASQPIIARLPPSFVSSQEAVDAIFESVTARTRLIVVSHITSPTAVILPVAQICRAARRRGIPVCIDGPHAPLQLPLAIDSLDCDFYTASCHKWLCAPFGSGFLYVHPRWQDQLKPLVQSWGRLPPKDTGTWQDEFYWAGTRDYAAYVTVPTAIDYFQSLGFGPVRARMHHLARYARRRLVELTGLTPLVPDDSTWYGSMAHVPLPDGRATALQQQLWEKYRIEVPIIAWGNRRFVRVSCHVYNSSEDIDRLVEALRELLGREGLVI